MLLLKLSGLTYPVVVAEVLYLHTEAGLIAGQLHVRIPYN